jgi:predicted S18 family serine protease
LFYSSASKSFQSLISSRFVSYACNYFVSNDEAYINSLINETQLIYDNKSKLVKNEDIKDMITLQCVGIAQKKTLEASSYLNDAITSFNDSNYLNSLYQLAYSYERSNSVEWWINLSSKFIDNNYIDQKTITELAEDYIDNAQQSIAYATVLLQEIGQNSNFLTSAEELLVTARNDEDQGYPAAALFDSLEALVKGNLALELVDGVTKNKIDRASESASISISESRMQGIEPILSVSYYELAESLENESSYDNAIFQYKYSDLIAGMVGLTSSSGSYSSRYIGIPELNLNSSEKVLLTDINEFSILQVFIGCIIGLFIGIIICCIVWLYKHKKKVSSF